MKIPDEWWSCPTQGESGQLIIVTGHDGLQPVIDKGKHKYRITVSMRYDALPDGMPTDAAAETLDAATEALKAATLKDDAAILTGIYTGEGMREWIFYTVSLHIFGNILNRALAPLPLLPLEIEAAEDPSWEEYRHMREETYISPEE